MDNRKIIILVSVFAVIVITFHFFSKRQPAGEEAGRMFDFFQKPLQWQGRYAPDFEIDLLNGEKFSLSENIGKKIIILNFFATWCGPCKAEMPELNRFYEKHKGEPFVLIGIDADEGEEKVKSFIKEYKIEFPVGIDKHKKIQKKYSVTGYPTTVFIGADGTVRIYEVGPIMNADIAFDSEYKTSMETIKAGNGIEKEAYLKNLKEQKDLKSADESEKDEYKLTGRAKEISEKMYCPCGCSDMVADCTCKTAKNIKKKLKTEDLSGKTDEEIIKELNKEFCVKGGKDSHDKS
ncbi:MAG: redoxin domain-containing protein [Nitrospirae bacterium]|nr:redoxin domain-containing protein [Nitrospirota bacterium]